MEVVVARIGRPHGLHGEVSVEVRTDDPEGRFAPGMTVRTDPAAAGPLTIDRRPGALGPAAAALRGVRRPHAAPRACATCCSSPTSTRPSGPTTRTSSTTTSSSGWPCAPWPANPSASSREVLHLPGQDVLAVRRPDGTEVLVPFVAEIVPRSTSTAGGRGRPAGRPARPTYRTTTPASSDVRLDVVTIFPEYLAPLRLSLIGRAVEDGLIDLHVHDLRDWTTDRHRTVDDTPYGGGPGMVMRPEPWGAALDAVIGEPAADAARAAGAGADPGGAPFTQAMAHELAAEPWLVFACGRYEGIDQRVLDEAASRGRVDRGRASATTCSTAARWRCW